MLLAVLVAGLLVLALLVLFVVQAFFIPSRAMEPTVDVGDRVLINRRSHLNGVDRGDIVVFKRPDRADGGPKTLIKRVVAVGGDTVESRGDVLHVNGQPADEPYAEGRPIGFPVTRTTVPPDKVFLLGDNRSNSADSRVFGPIDEDAIVGRAFLVLGDGVKTL